jgi:hypothetical protein
LLTGITLTVLVAALTVGGLLQLRLDTGPEAFLPAHDPSVEQAEQAARQFGGDAVIVLLQTTQPEALLTQDQLPKLVELEGRLAQLPDVATVFGPGSALNQIAAASQNLLARISGQRDGLMAAAEQQARAAGASEAQVQQARQQAVAAFDIRYGGLLARGLPAGLPTLHNPHFVHTLVFDTDGGPRPSWRFMVPDTTAIAISVRPREDIDQAATEQLVQHVRHAVTDAELPTSHVTISGAPALAAALGQQVRIEGPYLGVLALALIAGCYLLVPWTRRRRDRLIPLACTLIATAIVLAGFGWLHHPLSLGVVAFLPILVGTGGDFPAYLLQSTRPARVVTAALASTAGFAALGLSPLPFVRDLGLALALGLLVALAAAALARSIPSPTAPVVVLAPAPSPTRPKRDQASPRVRITVLAAATAAALGGWLLLPQLPIEAQPDVLASGLPALADAQHIESVVGSSGEIQVILRGSDVLTPAALTWMGAAQDAITVNYGDKLRPIVSLPDLLGFLGRSPTPEQITAAMTTLPPYLTGAAVSFDHHAAVIQLGMRLQDLHDQQRLLAELTHVLPAPPAGYHSQTVGLPVAAARAYDLLSTNRYLSNSLGIVLAGLVLLLSPRATRAIAPHAVCAALLATGWGLAAIWLLGIPLTPLTVALGSLSTATASEFTLMLSATHQGNPPRRTVSVAALAACLGYLALAVSQLHILRDFGLLLAATVLLSLSAAYLIVHAMPPHPAGPENRPHTHPFHQVRDLLRVRRLSQGAS